MILFLLLGVVLFLLGTELLSRTRFQCEICGERFSIHHTKAKAFSEKGCPHCGPHHSN